MCVFYYYFSIYYIFRPFSLSTLLSQEHRIIIIIVDHRENFHCASTRLIMNIYIVLQIHNILQHFLFFISSSRCIFCRFDSIRFSSLSLCLSLLFVPLQSRIEYENSSIRQELCWLSPQYTIYINFYNMYYKHILFYKPIFWQLDIINLSLDYVMSFLLLRNKRI